MVFRRLCDEGKTVVLVEHRVEDALMARPDRVLYMEAGEIKYLGTPEGLNEAVDWRQVKLPTAHVIKHLRANGQPPAQTLPPRPPTPTGEPLIKFENVRFGYGDGPDILHEINLEIHAGERVALLGPNGTGKSTLVKHAIGLVKPRAGRVLIGGKDTRELSVAQIARTIGYAFQSPTQMLFAPTVKEELAFGPRNLGYAAEEITRVSGEALSVVNLAGSEELPPLALSFGQQKRVTIACVVAMQSRILALDEPTAGQDFFNYMNFMDGLMGSEAAFARFAAMLFITHDLDLAITFASRVILMASGRIAADGPPETVLPNTELLEKCRVVPTTLLHENLKRLPQTGRFLRTEALAAWPE
jgi:energy-coupling factor transport system ATP-binding protein